MPKIAMFMRDRRVGQFRNLSREMRLQFLRNKIFYTIEPTQEEINEGILVEEDFDALTDALQAHTKGLYHVNTEMVDSEKGWVDEERFLRISICFELAEDLESFVKNHVMLEKLRT